LAIGCKRLAKQLLANSQQLIANSQKKDAPQETARPVESLDCSRVPR
jgi:hypothetical protein